jgi:TolB protein
MQTPSGPQLFVADAQGRNARQISRLPLTGYHNYGEGYCWSPDGNRLLYSHYDKLYLINKDGSGLQQLATAPSGFHFKSCDWSAATGQIVVQATDANVSRSRLYLLNPQDAVPHRLLENLDGRIESPVFSLDGQKLMFSYDNSLFQSQPGRQLDAVIMLYDLNQQLVQDLSSGKPAGTNDGRPRFSPNGAYIIFEHASNEDGAVSSVWKMNMEGGERSMLFAEACMPDWR